MKRKGVDLVIIDDDDEECELVMADEEDGDVMTPIKKKNNNKKRRLCSEEEEGEEPVEKKEEKKDEKKKDEKKKDEKKEEKKKEDEKKEKKNNKGKKEKKRDIGVCLACRLKTCSCRCWTDWRQDCVCPRRGDDGLTLPRCLKQSDLMSLRDLLHHVTVHNGSTAFCYCYGRARSDKHSRGDIERSLRHLENAEHKEMVKSWLTQRIKLSTMRAAPPSTLRSYPNTKAVDEALAMDRWMDPKSSLAHFYQWQQLPRGVESVHNVHGIPIPSILDALRSIQSLADLPPLCLWRRFHPYPTAIIEAERAYSKQPKIWTNDKGTFLTVYLRCGLEDSLGLSRDTYVVNNSRGFHGNSNFDIETGRADVRDRGFLFTLSDRYPLLVSPLSNRYDPHERDPEDRIPDDTFLGLGCSLDQLLKSKNEIPKRKDKVLALLTSTFGGCVDLARLVLSFCGGSGAGGGGGFFWSPANLVHFHS